MDILIVDDEPLARQRLVRMLNNVEHCSCVNEAESAEAALAAIAEHDPDVVLLDVRMPGEDGLSLAYRIAELEDPPAIIFCTAFDQYALDAFGTQAVGYLLKPVKSEHLLDALEKARRVNRLQRAQLSASASPEKRKTHLSVKTRRGVELLAVEDIRYFIADQKYVTAFHSGGDHLLDETLKQLEELFGEQFIRIHRNALVAVNHIEAIERNPQGQYMVRLTGVEQRPLVSRRHASNVKRVLDQL